AEFLVRNPVKEDWPRIRRWSQVAESEAFQESNPGEFSGAGMDDGEVVVAESPSGEIVGFSRLVIELVSGQREGRLVQVYVEQDFKGLGISEMLAGTLLKRAEDKGVKSLSARTEPSGRLLENFFENTGFSPVITWWRKTL
ncbi:MAG: GNAT family N-acetyltransferase, partial [Spirochaetaceae bacterium]|nr:GNAT family N-acetyltransferase [Spirochaetaceae bacterium]